MNVVRFGYELPYFFGSTSEPYHFAKAAKLNTPLVIGGITYKGIIQGSNGDVRWLYLTRSDLRSWETPFNWLYRGLQFGTFPYGYDVEPDSP